MADNIPIKRTYKNHQYTYNNSGTGLSENKPIDPYVPEEELLSEDYIQHVLTSDLVSLDAARGKIPISDPTTGRLRMSWIADQMATTTLPIASETEAKDPNNNDSVMTPKTTHIAIHDVVKDATTNRKGIVQLTDSLTQSVLDRSDLAITPLALKNYLAASGGFSHAGYNDAFGITAYASDMDVNDILSYSKTNTNATLRATDLYSDYSITPYTLYNYVSNNDLTLNTGKNIVFSSRAINGSTTAPTDIGKISVDRSAKSMTFTVDTKNITIDKNGNMSVPGALYSTVSSNKYLPPKLGNQTYGSASKPIYINAGVITECNTIDNANTANTAGQFTSAKEVTLTGSVTGTVSSTAGWVVPTLWRSCMVGQSGSSTTNPWYKVASISLPDANSDSIIDFLVEDTYSSHKYGILKVHIRTDGNKVVQTSATELSWLIHTGFTLSDFVLVCPTTASPKCELWTRVATGYMKRRFVVISEGDRNYTNTKWELFNSSSAGQAASITTAGTQIVSTTKGSVSTSDTATKDSSGKVIKDTYLPLTGGTITGPIKKATTSSSWVAGAKESAALNLTNTAGFNSAISMYTKSNKIGFATYPGSDDLVYLYSVIRANVNSDTNTVLKQLKWDSTNGTLYADTFSGPLSGNATSASKVNNTLEIKTTSSTYSSFNGSSAVKIDKVYASATADSAGTITSTLPISKGGTGATTRLTAAKALTNEDVGNDAQYFVTLTSSWGKFGYSSLANAKTALGLGSAAYTNSNAYLAADGTAASASKLSTARTITIRHYTATRKPNNTLSFSYVSGSGSFDGSGNVTINVGCSSGCASTCISGCANTCSGGCSGDCGYGCSGDCSGCGSGCDGQCSNDRDD